MDRHMLERFLASRSNDTGDPGDRDRDRESSADPDDEARESAVTREACNDRPYLLAGRGR